MHPFYCSTSDVRRFWVSPGVKITTQDLKMIWKSENNYYSNFFSHLGWKIWHKILRCIVLQLPGLKCKFWIRILFSHMYTSNQLSLSHNFTAILAKFSNPGVRKNYYKEKEKEKDISMKEFLHDNAPTAAGPERSEGRRRGWKKFCLK